VILVRRSVLPAGGCRTPPGSPRPARPSRAPPGGAFWFVWFSRWPCGRGGHSAPANVRVLTAKHHRGLRRGAHYRPSESGPSGPASGRCVGDVPPRGA